MKTDIYWCKENAFFNDCHPCNIYSLYIKIIHDLTHVSLMRALELTLNPSIRKPRVVVELSVSLHCMYLVFSTACWARSWTVGASGSTATIFSYMSWRGWGRSRASSSSSSRYVLWRTVRQCLYCDWSVLLVLKDYCNCEKTCTALT